MFQADILENIHERGMSSKKSKRKSSRKNEEIGRAINNFKIFQDVVANIN
jgi:hypothetical protein